MRFAAITLNLLSILLAMYAIVDTGGDLGTVGTTMVSIMILAGAISLLALYVDSANGADSDHVRSLKEAIKEAELEKQLRDLQEGNK